MTDALDGCLGGPGTLAGTAGEDDMAGPGRGSVSVSVVDGEPETLERL